MRQQLELFRCDSRLVAQAAAAAWLVLVCSAMSGRPAPPRRHDQTAELHANEAARRRWLAAPCSRLVSSPHLVLRFVALHRLQAVVSVAADAFVDGQQEEVQPIPEVRV